MAIRTDSGDVIDILGDHYNGTTSLTGFIATASNLVDWLASKDADSELSDETLELIERWLSGHFYAHADQIAQSRNTSGAGGTFQGQTAMLLTSTHYGQTAMLLDITGRLAIRSQEAETGKKVAKGFWGGKDLY